MEVGLVGLHVSGSEMNRGNGTLLRQEGAEISWLCLCDCSLVKTTWGVKLCQSNDMHVIFRRKGSS